MGNSQAKKQEEERKRKQEEDRKNQERQQREDEKEQKRAHEVQLANVSQEQRRLEQLKLEAERQMAECKERVEKERIGANLQVIQGHMEQNKEMVGLIERIQEREIGNMQMAENRRMNDAREQARERERQGREMRYIILAILAMTVLVCALLMWNKGGSDERAWKFAAEEREEAARRELQRQADMERMSAELERRLWTFALGVILLFVLLLFWLRQPQTDGQAHQTRSTVRTARVVTQSASVTRRVAVQPTSTTRRVAVQPPRASALLSSSGASSTAVSGGGCAQPASVTGRVVGQSSVGSQRAKVGIQPKSDGAKPKTDDLQKASLNGQPKSAGAQPSATAQPKNIGAQPKSATAQPKNVGARPKSAAVQR